MNSKQNCVCDVTESDKYEISDMYYKYLFPSEYIEVLK